MRLGQAIRHLNPVFDGLVERKRSFLQALGQRLALYIFHDEVVDAVLLAHVVKRADVWVVELRDRLRLALESLPSLGALGEVSRKDLDGDGAVEPCVVGLVDLAHASRTYRREDLVGA